jgi:hypothetical protein
MRKELNQEPDHTRIGFVDQPLFEEYLFPSLDECYNLICGPPVMITKGCEPNLSGKRHANSLLETSMSRTFIRICMQIND